MYVIYSRDGLKSTWGLLFLPHRRRDGIKLLLPGLLNKKKYINPRECYLFMPSLREVFPRRWLFCDHKHAARCSLQRGVASSDHLPHAPSRLRYRMPKDKYPSPSWQLPAEGCCAMPRLKKTNEEQGACRFPHFFIILEMNGL